jgi:hypothetical protein
MPARAGKTADVSDGGDIVLCQKSDEAVDGPG